MRSLTDFIRSLYLRAQIGPVQEAASTNSPAELSPTESRIPSNENAASDKPLHQNPMRVSSAVGAAPPLPQAMQQAKDAYQRGDVTDAEQLCRSILNGAPDQSEALNLLGIIAAQMHRPQEAIKLLSQAIAIDAKDANAHNNLGNVLHELKRHEEALEIFDRALTLNPDDSEIHYNRSGVLGALKRYDDALAGYGHALKIKPDYVEAHFNMSQHLLHLGDFARGWEEYEWRWQTARNRNSKNTIDAPAWEGQKLRGSLLVWNEQGLGDEIFYAGMLNDLAPYAQAITVCVDHRLVRLFQRSFGNMKVTSRQTLAPDAHFDAHIPMGSLGRYLRSSFSAFPDRSTPYLHACSSRARNLHAKIANEKRLLCGLSWVSKNLDFGTDKSLRLQDLAPLLTVPGIDFVDLQYGDTDQEQAALLAATGLRLKRVSEIDNFNDIDGLAALIEACEVIVTISNTTAHLAAALGKPVLLMLPFSQGVLWYWHADRAENPWYPNVRSFRQPVMGDWESVIDSVSKVLARQRVTLCEAAATEGHDDR